MVTVESLNEAIDFVNAREKPLTLYVFTESRKTFERINKITSAGGVCHNDTIMQAGGEWKKREREGGREREKESSPLFLSMQCQPSHLVVLETVALAATTSSTPLTPSPTTRESSPPGLD